MRIRKRAWTEGELRDNEKVIKTPEQYKGRWSEFFGNTNPIYVEIGCGKGGFITENARRYPDINFVGIERQEAVVAVAAKYTEQSLDNLILLWENARNLSELFDVGEFQRLYLNFSDPWPKKRTYKRRLTYAGFLREYHAVMGEAELFFKTDNKGLFEFSLNEFCKEDWKLSNISLDLHNGDCEDNIMTEYEKKFSEKGDPIYRLEARKSSEK
ncbi:MAG: tRNA (guanosine(46)-N7)-methyltransferase TrmB [Bacillota bacterium]